MTPQKHKQIAIEACLPILHKEFPGEELGFFLLGNWFTDVSQGIAPVDYAASMTSARNEGVDAANKGSWFLRNLIPDSIIHWQADKFVKELLGSPPPQNSAMATWFRNAVFVAGWVEFCWPDGPAKDLAASGAGPMNFDEYDRLYHSSKLGKTGEGRFTQYFPHEHFDRWPMDRVEKSHRKVYAYIEDHIGNIAELLSLVERDWAKYATQNNDASLRRRHDILAEFGYAMHTAEDYWAHTNFVDFSMRAVNSIPSDPDQRRIHERRLLRDTVPRTTMFGEPGPTEAETHVVGGYFDGIDTRFSLVQLYLGFKQMLALKTKQRSPVWGCGARDCPSHKKQADRCASGTWYCRRKQSPCPGHEAKGDSCRDPGGNVWDCGEKDCPTHSRKTDTCASGTWYCGRIDPPCAGHSNSSHQCPEVAADVLDYRNAKTKDQRQQYRKALAASQAALNMPEKVRKAELAFIELDWAMIDKWDGKCVSWVLEKMLKEGTDYKEQKFKDGSKYSERIGSHTLIAKDDETKQPGYDQAKNLAKRLDSYIMETMSAATKSRTAPAAFSGKSGNASSFTLASWVDWLELLRYFMGHPGEAADLGGGGQKKHWWMDALKTAAGDHGHKLTFINSDEMETRAKLMTRQRLEREHNSMIRIENAKYQAEYHKDGKTTEESATLARKGDTKKYTHDDMDFGSVRIRCLAGQVKVDLSAAVWSSFKPIASASVVAGDVWSGDFTELSKVYDQDNRAIIAAEADNSKFEFIMVSYDR